MLTATTTRCWSRYFTNVTYIIVVLVYTLHAKALVGIDQTIQPNLQGPKWVSRKTIYPYSLVLRTCTSAAQKLPGDLESKPSTFHEDKQAERQKHHSHEEQIGNIDETPPPI